VIQATSQYPVFPKKEHLESVGAEEGDASSMCGGGREAEGDFLEQGGYDPFAIPE